VAAYVANKLSVSERTSDHILTCFVLAGSGFILLFFFAYDVSVLFVFSLFALIFFGLLVIHYFHDDFPKHVSEGMCRPSGLETWVDFYASADPVPNGETSVARGAPDTVQVWNSGSRFKDHTTYWRNIDGFVIPLIKCLAKAAESSLAEQLPVEKDSIATRAQLRVRWLQTARALIVLFVIGYLWWYRPVLSEIGANVHAYVAVLLSSFPFVEIPTKISGVAPSIVGASTIVLAGWIGYVVVRCFWWRWVQSEQEVVANHFEPDGVPRAFSVFSMVLLAVLFSGLMIAFATWRLTFQGLPSDLTSWISLIVLVSIVWGGIVITGYNWFVINLAEKGPWKLWRSK
jgi:hypothetical protein